MLCQESSTADSGYPHLVQTVASTSYITFCSSFHQCRWATWHFLLGHLQHGWACHVTSLKESFDGPAFQIIWFILLLHVMADLSAASIIIGEHLHNYLCVWSNFFQGCSKGTSSVALEVNNQLWNRFYKFFHIFNIKYKFVHLQLFNIKYKFVQLQLFDIKFLFSEKHIFRKQKRTAVYERVPLGLNSPGKMMTCCLWGTNTFLRYCILCTSTLKCGFPTKGIELTQLVILRHFRCLSF